MATQTAYKMYDPSMEITSIIPQFPSPDTNGNIIIPAGIVIYLREGVYFPEGKLIVPSNTILNGQGSNITFIDFQNDSGGIFAEGTNPYTDGTVDIAFGDTAVTGHGTNWDSTMIGQSIMLEDFWYNIANVSAPDAMTIDSSYAGTTLSTNRYAIATTVNNVHVNGVTLQNSTGSLLKSSYANNMNGVDLNLLNGTFGFDYNWISNLNHTVQNSDSCGIGASYNDVAFATTSPNVSNCTGDGFVANHFRNSVITDSSFVANAGRGMALENTNNVGLENNALQGNTGIQLEFIAGCFDVQVSLFTIFEGGSDGIKITDSSHDLQIGPNSIHDNGGHGINIASSACERTVVVGNSFSDNTGNDVLNLGLETVIEGNSPITINLSSLFGSGAPGDPPYFIGQQYIDVMNAKVYVATGAASPTDWQLLN